MQSKDTENERLKQQSLLNVELHIMAAIRQGREISMQEVEAMQEQYLLPVEIILERLENIRKEHGTYFGFDNKTPIDKAIIHFKKAGLKRNLVTGQIENKEGKQVTLDDIYIDLVRAGQKVPKEDLRSLVASKHIETFHPFDKYLTGLGNMSFDNSIDYFAKLSEYVITDRPKFFAVMLKKHFIRTIDQYKRNIPNRYVFVLYGGQEKGKSIFIKWLNPLTINYYSEQPLRNDKDGEIMLATVLIYSIEELEGLSKQEINKTKSFISRSSINERRPYAAEAISMPRLATIFASTNDRGFLTDIINTRWLIPDVKHINHDYNNIKTGRKDIDVNSLWLQAYNEWKTDNSAGMLTPEEKAMQEEINKCYNISTPEYHLIIKHLRKPIETDRPKEETQFPSVEGIEFLSATDILIRLTGLYPSIKINSAWLGREMKRAGFVSRVSWINCQSFRGYDVVWSSEGFKESYTNGILPF